MTAEVDIWDGADNHDPETGREFHPTWARPIPGMQCTGVVKNGPRTGERCHKRAVYGATVCMSHGAQLPVVREKAQRVIEAARMRLFDLTADAVIALEDLLQPGTAEGVRLKAATEVLDRAGIRGGVEVDVKQSGGPTPAEQLRDRLQELRERVVEGEIVSRRDEPVPDETDEPSDPAGD